MNRTKTLAKNTTVLFISQISVYLFTFFTNLYLARYLGVEGFGIISFALALTGIFSIFIDLGLNTLTIREVARNKSKANDYISNIVAIRLLLSTLTFITIYLVVYLLGYNTITSYVIYFLTFYIMINSFCQLFYSIFQANEKMEYQSLGNVISGCLIFFGVLIAIYCQFNIIQLVSTYAIVSVIILIYILIMFFMHFDVPKVKPNIQKWKSLINESWPFAITSISIYLYVWLDTIILSFIQGQEAVGLYNAAYKLIMALLFIPTVFNNAVFPIMSQFYLDSKKKLQIIFEKLFKLMSLVAFPIGVGTFLLAEKIINLIYGTQFNQSIIVLQILIWSMVLIFVRSPIERLLESSNKQLTLTKIYFIGLIFNMILNIIVIPLYSYVGAAFSTVLTDILIVGLLICIFRNDEFSVSMIHSDIFKIIIASLIMGTILKIFLNLNLVILIIIGTVSYLIMIYVLRIFDEEEISLIKSIFDKKIKL